jgi:hypothetical protein
MRFEELISLWATTSPLPALSTLERAGLIIQNHAVLRRFAESGFGFFEQFRAVS